MSYHQLLDDGSEIGTYSSKKSPQKVAETIAREVYDRNLLRGEHKIFVRFIRSNPFKEYFYDCVVTPLKHPEIIQTSSGKQFMKHFDIKAKRH